LGDEDVKPVGEEFIEEDKDSLGKFVAYMCKLCDCKFSDINAKNVHLKGRRHRLQYKVFSDILLTYRFFSKKLTQV